MVNNPVIYEALAEQYLRSILDISEADWSEGPSALACNKRSDLSTAIVPMKYYTK